MKPLDQALERLLAAASHVAPARPAAAPAGLETHVMAQWRAAEPEDDSALLALFLRRAMVYACMTLVSSAVWGLSQGSADLPTNEMSLSDYQMQLSLWP